MIAVTVARQVERDHGAGLARAPFLADPKLSQQGYLTVEPLLLKAQGVTPTVFLLADYGYDPYANILMLSRKMATEKHDVVQRFIDASIKGWYGFLYGSNQKAIDLIIKEQPDYTQKNATESLGALKSGGLIDSGDAKKLGIGAMTDARWKSFFDEMVKAGVAVPTYFVPLVIRFPAKYH